MALTPKAAKAVKLTIELDFYKPKFTFEGDWTGKDVKVVRNLLWRGWLQHTQLIRRETANVIPQEVTQ